MTLFKIKVFYNPSFRKGMGENFGRSTFDVADFRDGIIVVRAFLRQRRVGERDAIFAEAVFCITFIDSENRCEGAVRGIGPI